MGLRAEVEAALAELLTEEMIGSSLVVDGIALEGIWRDASLDSQSAFAGQIVQRRRLICRQVDFSAEVGEEIEIDSQRWLVINKRPTLTFTDLVVERFTA